MTHTRHPTLAPHTHFEKGSPKTSVSTSAPDMTGLARLLATQNSSAANAVKICLRCCQTSDQMKGSSRGYRRFPAHWSAFEMGEALQCTKLLGHGKCGEHSSIGEAHAGVWFAGGTQDSYLAPAATHPGDPLPVQVSLSLERPVQRCLRLETGAFAPGQGALSFRRGKTGCEATGSALARRYT
jgi:hypothetical protein